MMRKTVLILILCAAAASAPAEKAVLHVTADVGVSSVVGKKGLSNGRGPTTAIMQNQNWGGFENMNLLMAFDTKPIKGWTISKATMHLWLAKGDLYGVGLCTVLADWQEGRALNYVERVGAPCWLYRRTPEPHAKPTAENWWAWPGSMFFSVSWSHPAARYSNAGPGQIRRQKTKNGRFLHLQFPVEPKLVESLAAGVASGLGLTDDKGQVRESYSLLGPAYPYVYNAAEDIWVFTKDIQDGQYRPRLEVVGQAIDKTPPAAPRNLKVTEVSPSDGSFTLEFVAPGDDGTTGEVLAYAAARSDKPITEANWAQAAPLPRWSLPEPVPAGKVQRMPVFTLPPGKHHLAVRGVDEAGNRGAVADLAVTVPQPPSPDLAKAAWPKGSAKTEPWVAEKGKLSVFAVSDMDKVDPVTGWLMNDAGQYRAQAGEGFNPVWNAKGPTVYLTAAANEVAAFQLVLGQLAGKLTDVRVSVGDLTSPGGRKIAADPNVQSFRLWYVSAGRRPRGARPPRSELQASTWYGEVALPLSKPFDETFAIPAADNKVPAQKCQSVWVDVYVPRGTAAGDYKGTITVAAKELARPATLSLQLKVLPLSLPDKYTFVLELNRYHSMAGWAGVDARKDPKQAIETTLDFYRLAHRHRCIVNALPYSHSGRVDGWFIPVMEGTGTDVRVKDWTEFDRRFGPLLDGSAFSAKTGYVGPGANVPINHMYTAFHEAWPIWLDKNTYKDWMACNDRIDFAEYAKKARRPHVAFTEQYKQGFKAVAKQFFGHFKAKGWTQTSLHFYNNNKYYWKVAYFGGMGRGGVCFWLMDEPSDFDDYDVNGFVMGLGVQAHKEAGAPEVRMDGRVDVSQADMTRGLWDDIATVWCVGGLRGFSPTIRPRQRWLANEKHWCYGGGIAAQSASVGQSRSCLLRWSFGADGWMPWWDTFRGRGGAWNQANNLAIYYSGANYANSGRNYPGPIAGVRIKISRRCQQDMEYLNLLAGCEGWDRHRVRRAVAAYSDDPEAPLLRYGDLTLAKLRELRARVAATIMAQKK